LEGFPYDQEKGVKEDAVSSADMPTLESLKKISKRVIGLETEKTALFSKSLVEKKEFERDYRCTVANREWASLVKREGQGGSLNVVCCGTAHLVQVKEKDGQCASLEEHFKLEQIDGTKSLAVAFSNNGLYKPDGSSESVEAMDPIDEEFLEEGSDTSDSDD
jgi:hypothetical protein